MSTRGLIDICTYWTNVTALDHIEVNHMPSNTAIDTGTIVKCKWDENSGEKIYSGGNEIISHTKVRCNILIERGAFIAQGAHTISYKNILDIPIYEIKFVKHIRGITRSREVFWYYL